MNRERPKSIAKARRGHLGDGPHAATGGAGDSAVQVAAREGVRCPCVPPDLRLAAARGGYRSHGREGWHAQRAFRCRAGREQAW